MSITTDFGLKNIVCTVCGEEMFLDWKGDYYICINGCRRVKNVFKRKESMEE